MRRPKGEGTVERVGQKFRARKTIQRQRVYGALRDTWAEADRDRVILEAPLSKTDGRDMILSDYIKSLLLGRWGKGARASAKATWETDEAHWRNHIAPSTLGQTQLTDITRRDIQDFIDLQTCAKRTIRRIGAVVSKACSAALEDELLDRNPHVGVRYPKIEERQNRTLRALEAAILINPQTRMDAMVLVCLHVGLRRAECCAVEWEDVEPFQMFVRGSKNERSKATTSITPEAYAAMMEQPRRSKYVFTTASGGPVSPDNFTRDWRSWRKEKWLDEKMRLERLGYLEGV